MEAHADHAGLEPDVGGVAVHHSDDDPGQDRIGRRADCRREREVEQQRDRKATNHAGMVSCGLR